MFRKFFGVVVSLVLAAGASLPMASNVHAGGSISTPTVEWSNPGSIMYGGWPVSTSAYLHNPTAFSLVFVASAWFNSQAIETERGGVFLVNASYEALRYEGRNCDDRGCLIRASGTIQAYSRIYAVFGMYSGRNLGQNLTVGSITVAIERMSSPLYAEGRANLVEGPGTGLSVKLEPDSGFPVQGGYLPLIVKATDRTLNNFQLLGAGADCTDAIVPTDMTPYKWEASTKAEWFFPAYIPDNVKTCTITVLVKTRETVISASYTVKR